MTTKRTRRQMRTVILAVAAMGTLIWSAVTQFDVPTADLIQAFVGSLGALFLVILAAALAVALMLTLRWLWRRRQSDP